MYVHDCLVLDVNDNTPKFERPSYSCRLSAEVESGQLVTVVHAEDPDQELLRYALTGDTTAFRVNPHTGKYPFTQQPSFQNVKHLAHKNNQRRVRHKFSKASLMFAASGPRRSLSCPLERGVYQSTWCNDTSSGSSLP